MILSAVIFDLDGTIIDSENAWKSAFAGILKNLGVTVDSEQLQITFGASLKVIWKTLIDKYSIRTEKSLDELEIMTYLEYEKHISSIEIQPGFFEFVDFLKENNFRMGLATSTKWDTADKILDLWGLNEVFECITTGEEVISLKPDPQIYLVEADKLGVEVGECLAIEDSPSGIEAAKEAGMKVIAISSGENRKDLTKADLIVEEFSEITASVIDQL
jgi:HAD superfamily hydrolase (TIGR01549 family)